MSKKKVKFGKEAQSEKKKKSEPSTAEMDAISMKLMNETLKYWLLVIIVYN